MGIQDQVDSIRKCWYWRWWEWRFLFLGAGCWWTSMSIRFTEFFWTSVFFFQFLGRVVLTELLQDLGFSSRSFTLMNSLWISNFDVHPLSQINNQIEPPWSSTIARKFSQDELMVGNLYETCQTIEESLWTQHAMCIIEIFYLIAMNILTSTGDYGSFFDKWTYKFFWGKKG